MVICCVYFAANEETSEMIIMVINEFLAWFAVTWYFVNYDYGDMISLIIFKKNVNICVELWTFRKENELIYANCIFLPKTTPTTAFIQYTILKYNM